MILELGCGRSPNESADVHHDRTKHSDYVDVEHDLVGIPWPWEDEQFEQIIAIDVFEHLDSPWNTQYTPGRSVSSKLPWWFWLNQCRRILAPDGLLVMRLPAWDNPLTYRDPTHRTPDGGVRAFHEQTFLYWDPCHILWRDFGSIYGLTDGSKFWHQKMAIRDHGDIRFVLQKVDGGHGYDPALG